MELGHLQDLDVADVMEPDRRSNELANMRLLKDRIKRISSAQQVQSALVPSQSMPPHSRIPTPQPVT